LGANPLVAVVGHQSAEVTEAIERAFPSASVRFAIQAEQKGTGHAVQASAGSLREYSGPILILYGDVPLLRLQTLRQLFEKFQTSKVPLALVTTLPPDPTGYGRVVRKQGAIARVVEQKDCSPEELGIREANAGIYVAQSDFLWPGLERIRKDNAQGEFYLTDLVQLAAEAGGVASITAEFAETIGVNDRVELATCAKVIQQQLNEKLMRQGVTLLDPSTAWITEDVQIGEDAEIGPSVAIAASKIGRAVRIGQGCILNRATVGDDCEIKPYSVIEDSVLGKQCIVGPFARLRPGTDLADGVHLGNFVETKKARLGAGTKANHLSYLGDAVIGASVNVGAGTITCNFDGVNKHETVLGDNVFVGSDTQFVAPVKVGEGAYIGAGTTVTEDVPPKSLSLSRSPQVIKEGWVARKKPKQKAK
jgi:bifunctional UDP-N-acetylglucosamine pyrophosphorylase/glucosamine-1-phosphate N-acetyltransferase